MALNPHSEKPDLGSPPDYAAHHPQEHPEQWGWHGEWGRTSRVGAVIVGLVLLVMLTTTHYNDMGDVYLFIFAGAMLVVLIWDHQRRRRSWRK